MWETVEAEGLTLVRCRALLGTGGLAHAFSTRRVDGSNSSLVNPSSRAMDNERPLAAQGNTPFSTSRPCAFACSFEFCIIFRAVSYNGYIPFPRIDSTEVKVMRKAIHGQR